MNCLLELEKYLLKYNNSTKIEIYFGEFKSNKLIQTNIENIEIFLNKIKNKNYTYQYSSKNIGFDFNYYHHIFNNGRINSYKYSFSNIRKVFETNNKNIPSLCVLINNDIEYIDKFNLPLCILYSYNVEEIIFKINKYVYLILSQYITSKNENMYSLTIKIKKNLLDNINLIIETIKYIFFENNN